MTAAPLPAGVEKLAPGKYRGRYYGPDGHRHSTAIYAKPYLAKHALDAAKADILAGRWLDPQRSVTLDVWMSLWMPTRLHAGTSGRTVRPYVLDKDWARYNNHIKPYLGRMRLPKITRFTVETWHAKLAADGRSVSTIHKAHTLLKTALHRAMDDDRTIKNPCGQTQPRRPDLPDWTLLTKGDFDRLFAVIPAWYQPVVLTAAKTGLRWSEIAGLTRADYNPLRRQLHVSKGTTAHSGRLIDGPTKSGKGRTLPVVDALATALDSRIAAVGMAADARLFTTPGGATLSGSNFLHRVWRPAAVTVNLGRYTEDAEGQRHYEGVRFHDLRHSFISWLLNDGVDIHEVKELAGHASITTTELYAHTDQDELRSAMARALG